jgi:hypothetical protein
MPIEPQTETPASEKTLKFSDESISIAKSHGTNNDEERNTTMPNNEELKLDDVESDSEDLDIGYDVTIDIVLIDKAWEREVSIWWALSMRKRDGQPFNGVSTNF